MSYKWESANTPQGRERLKELVDGLKGRCDFIIVALSYKQGERHLQNIFFGRDYLGKSDLDRFLDDPIPIKEFIDPNPISSTQSEVERLRRVVDLTRQYCEQGNGRGGATKLPTGEWFDEGEGTLYHEVLSAL